MFHVKLRPLVLLLAAIGIIIAGVVPPVLLLEAFISRLEPSPVAWLFAFSFTTAILMVSFLYLVRVKAAHSEFRQEERERELSWEIFQRGYVHKDDVFQVARAWSKIDLPYKRKLLLVRAGVLPEDSLKEETLELSDDSLKVMSSLVYDSVLLKS